VEAGSSVAVDAGVVAAVVVGVEVGVVVVGVAVGVVVVGVGVGG